MSNEAITWALGQKVDRSSAKFVLVAMANLANGDMTCFPSIQYLSDATCQDRKTVAENLKRLRESGHIVDTGARKGSTGQVPVYRLNDTENGIVIRGVSAKPKSYERDTNGPAGNPVFHYIYRVTDNATGNFYVGVRTSHCAPENDQGYMGSGRWCQMRTEGRASMTKEILGDFGSRDEANQAEQVLIAASMLDGQCMNIAESNGANSTENGIESKNQTVPKTDSNSPVFPHEESRFSPLTVPKTGHEHLNTPKDTTTTPQKKRASFVLPEWVPEDAWNAYIEMRKKKRKEPTEYARDLVIKELAAILAGGHSLKTALDNSTKNGWTDVYAPKPAPQARASPAAPQSRHSGFENIDYREGVTEDGRIT